MMGVNKQLALFFHQVGMKNYRKKLIAAFITIYFLVYIQIYIIRILMYYINIDKIYLYVAVWLFIIMSFSVYLIVALVFYYLADF